jgi:hypothetical protein
VEKWSAVAAFCKVSTPALLLHPTAVRANKWWLELSQLEEAFWDGVDGESKVPVYEFDWIGPSLPVSNEMQLAARSVYVQQCLPLLSLMDDCTEASVHLMMEELKALHVDLHSAYCEVALADAIVREDCGKESLQTPLYVCHKSDRISDREVFDPMVHVELGSVVVMMVDGVHTSTPWALARVSRPPYAMGHSPGQKFIDVVYLMPATFRASARSVDVGKSKQSEWGSPASWLGSKLIDWPLPRGGKWEDCGIDVGESVWWACKPTISMTLFKRGKDRQIMASQIARIEALVSTKGRRTLSRVPAARDATNDPMPMFGTLEDDDDM